MRKAISGEKMANFVRINGKHQLKTTERTNISFYRAVRAAERKAKNVVSEATIEVQEQLTMVFKMLRKK